MIQRSFKLHPQGRGHGAPTFLPHRSISNVKIRPHFSPPAQTGRNPSHQRKSSAWRCHGQLNDTALLQTPPAKAWPWRANRLTAQINVKCEDQIPFLPPATDAERTRPTPTTLSPTSRRPLF